MQIKNMRKISKSPTGSMWESINVDHIYKLKKESKENFSLRMIRRINHNKVVFNPKIILCLHVPQLTKPKTILLRKMKSSKPGGLGRLRRYKGVTFRFVLPYVFDLGLKKKSSYRRRLNVFKK